MPHPILSALDGFERPPQLIRLEKKIEGRVGDEVEKKVKFVIHEEDEHGMTLRFVDIEGSREESNDNSDSQSEFPRIIPSPSA